MAASSSRRQILVIALAGISAAILYWQFSTRRDQTAANDTGKQSKSASGDGSEPVQYPIGANGDRTQVEGGEGRESNANLAKDNSASFEEALSAIFGQELFASVFDSEDIVRKIVVTVDSAAGPAQPRWEMMPLKPIESEFLVTGADQNTTIAPENSQRYSNFVALAQSVDPERLVSAYVHFYSLFQAAYRELGSKRYFNDRLVEVINKILQTPDIKDPIKVIRPSPHNRFKFADVQLENLSSGQKALLRMGRENAMLIKKKLREFRNLLMHLGPVKK